jgi:hypothetical protein
LVLGLAVAVFAGVQVSNGALYFFNETSDLRGSVFLKVFDLARWWDLNYSSVLVRASVGAEWRFERVEGALLDYVLFWEDCSYCDSVSPPPVKNRNTLYEDLILRVTYVGGRWVVGVLWGHGFGQEVYVNGSLLYRKPPGYAGEPGVWGEYVGVALEVKLVSLGDSRADAAALFTAFDRAHEALACAAALGLDARETNGLLRHFGVSGEVVRVRRGDGGAAFVFRNGSAVSVPLVLDVDVGQWGRFVLVNPCGAAVNWTLRLYVDNKTLGSRPGGRLAAEVSADMAPYSVAPVYVFGVAEEAGLYRVSYRLYVRPGVYDVWGYRVEVDRERLAAANGSIANWLWGFFESLAGKAAGDRCAEARGAGRRWAAERIGWAGVATEVDTALGGAAFLFSAGTYGAGRTAARGAAEAVMFGKHIVGVRETGDVAVMKARDNGRRFEVTSLKLQSSATISSGGGYEIRISKYKAGTASYLVSEVVDINTKRLVVVGYNDMFTALAIARGFRGDIYRGVYKDRELYIISYDFDRSLVDAVEAYPETFYKYLSTALMPKVVGVNPAAVGAEVTLPAVFDMRWDLVIADTAFGKAAFVPLCLEGFCILGVLDDGWLLMGEVKNMGGVGGPADLGLGDVAERAKVLGDLLRDNSALLSALVSVYNGGRLPGGGKVSSSFMAGQVLIFPDLRKIFGQGGVKFVVVAAGASRAVVFVYDVSLDQLQDRGFLERVAEEVFYGFRLVEARERLYSIDEAVRGVVDRYGAYTKYVEFLKS